MTIDADARGRRVVVRHTVVGRGPSGGQAMTDVVGRLITLTDTEAHVERRDGSMARVPLADVVTWKVVPDRPRRSRPAADFAPDELARITSRGWPPVESVPLGEWELRAAGSFTGRANSVAVHGDPGAPIDEALDAVVRFYTERGLPPLAQVVVGSPTSSALEDAGWLPMSGYRDGAVVQVADIEPGHTADPGARIEPSASDAWLGLYQRIEDDAASARAVLEGPPTVGFVTIGEPPMAIGRVVVTGEWAGIAAVEVRPERRREGLGRRVVETALAWAVDHGATKAYLQTMRDNTAAFALYEPFGFATHHEYRYLQPPA